VIKKKFAVTAAALAIGIGGFAWNARAADKAEEHKEHVHEKHEAEKLANMPAEARHALKAATEGTTNPDYFKLTVDGKPVFGATFVAADNKHYEVRVAKDGTLISKEEAAADATADAAKAAADSAAAQKARDDAAAAAKGAAIAPAAMQPGVATPAMIQGRTAVADTASFPAPVKERLAGETMGCKNVHYYTSTAEGTQLYESDYDTLDQVHVRLRVQPNGRIFSKQQDRAGEVSMHSPIELDQAPAAARKMLQTETAGVKNPEFFKVTEGGKTSYEAAFAGEQGKTRHVRISEEGKIVSKHDTGGAAAKQ
jgi:hypothetical protein